MSAAARAPRFAPDPRRRAMIGKVKIAQKELGLDEAVYRALLDRVVGRSSAADCTEAQLARVLDELKRLGWKPVVAKGGKAGAAPTSKPRPADHAVAGKARALWISLHHLGVVRDPSERALEAFAKRQLGVERLQWADQSQGFRLIEALKAMGGRAGWFQPAGAEVIILKIELVKAQWGRLTELGAIKGGEPPVCSGLSNWANGRVTTCLKAVQHWSEAELDAAAPLLGAWIWRKAPTPE